MEDKSLYSVSIPTHLIFGGDPLDKEFLRAVVYLHVLQLKKGQTYKDSWRKRGEVGVFHNIARKFDRLERCVEIAGKGRNLDLTVIQGESVIDTVADLAVYASKLLTLFEEEHPVEFKQWLDDALEGIEFSYDTQSK